MTEAQARDMARALNNIFDEGLRRQEIARALRRAYKNGERTAWRVTQQSSLEQTEEERSLKKAEGGEAEGRGTDRTGHA